jgi:hypothetical protein
MIPSQSSEGGNDRPTVPNNTSKASVSDALGSLALSNGYYPPRVQVVPSFDDTLGPEAVELAASATGPLASGEGAGPPLRLP